MFGIDLNRSFKLYSQQAISSSSKLKRCFHTSAANPKISVRDYFMVFQCIENKQQDFEHATPEVKDVKERKNKTFIEQYDKIHTGGFVVDG